MKTTVIVPAYNCSQTIAETLASINLNREAVQEVIVVNDASTDDTVSKVKTTPLAVPLKVINHGHNQGGAAARNTAMRAVATEYAFCLDSDNLLVEGSLAELMTFAKRTSADVASFRRLHYFKTDPNQITHRWQFKAGTISLADYLAGGVVPGASGNYAYRKSAWAEVGGYPEFAKSLDAWGSGLRLVANSKSMMVMEHGHYLHRHGHESYWVRELRRSNISHLARQILSPFESLLHPTSQAVLDRNPDHWFEDLDEVPLRTRDGRIGKTGIVLPRGLRGWVRSALNP